MKMFSFEQRYAEEILLPVRPRYLALTLFAAFMLNLLPLEGMALAARPDFVSLVLLYWGLEHPRRVGFAAAFALGLIMDVSAGSLLGQHALAYSVLMAAAIALQRRVPLFGAREQILHVFGVLLGTQLIVLSVRLSAGGDFPGWWYFLPTVTGALIWPAVRQLVRAPLRLRPNPEDI
jgi:rod shape-determining protein MreD